METGEISELLVEADCAQCIGLVGMSFAQELMLMSNSVSNCSKIIAAICVRS